ncbi:DNA double-strand break repair nuclease NurA [Tissierella pigra]|nr:DNA double-strand break repair nuclease NurA [Tissierella pigra]
MNLNNSMEERYREVLSIDKLFLRRFIEEYIGKITSLKKLDNKYLALYEAKGGIVGVDGSTNRMGGAYPHFVDIFQGLAKSTIINNKAIFKSDLYTPLFSEKENNILAEDEKEIAEQRNKLLANIEVEVALEAVRKYKPYAILMDGSLIRYNIYSYDSWINLRDECENQGVLLVGVIKDIKTSIIGDKLKEVYSNINVEVYDRELLFGQLQYGEMIIINDEVNKKNKEGYSSIFMRSSLQPTVIGMDIIDSQKEYLEEMGRLVFTLTPENSRGVPLWLDIVDKEVQISDAIMKGLMERYMNRDLYERFFVSERAKRN